MWVPTPITHTYTQKRIVPVMYIGASLALERSYENRAMVGLSEMQGTKKREEG